jgi:hypothetical protein
LYALATKDLANVGSNAGALATEPVDEAITTHSWDREVDERVGQFLVSEVRELERSAENEEDRWPSSAPQTGPPSGGPVPSNGCHLVPEAYARRDLSASSARGSAEAKARTSSPDTISS